MLGASLALSWLCGILVARLFLGPFTPWWRPTLAAAALGAGLGAGVSSVVSFLALLAGTHSRWVTVGAEALTIGLVGSAIRFYPGSPSPVPRPPAKLPWLFGLVLAVAGAAAIGSLSLLYSLAPHGDWDAWSIWNLKARFLFLSGEAWRDVLTPSLAQSHPDYPLLVPGAVARLWTLTGEASTAAPAGLAILMCAATAGLLTDVIWRLRGPVQAVLACTLLLGAGSFVRAASSQYADVPLSFFLLASAATLAIAENGRTAALAGLCAALGGWTKNEGLMLTGAIVAARFAVTAKRSGIRHASREALWFVTGAAPVLALTLWFKTALAPAGDLVSSASAARLADPSRYAAILEAVLGEIWRFGNLPVSLVLVLPAYLWLAGVSRVRSDAGAATGVVTLGLAALGYGGVYLVAPNDLKWQLQTSLSRLFVQCWPLAVFVFFLIARAPGHLSNVNPKPVV